MVNLRLKDGKELSQDHIATEWQNQYFFLKSSFFNLLGTLRGPLSRPTAGLTMPPSASRGRQ